MIKIVCMYEQGNVHEDEMARTFNCGIGAVLVVSKDNEDRVMKELEASETAWTVGSVCEHKEGYN